MVADPSFAIPARQGRRPCGQPNRCQKPNTFPPQAPPARTATPLARDPRRVCAACRVACPTQTQNVRRIEAPRRIHGHWHDMVKLQRATSSRSALRHRQPRASSNSDETEPTAPTTANLTATGSPYHPSRSPCRPRWAAKETNQRTGGEGRAHRNIIPGPTVALLGQPHRPLVI